MKIQTSLKDYFRLPPPLLTQVRNAAVAFLALIVIGFAVSLLRPDATYALLEFFMSRVAGAGMFEMGAGGLFAAVLVNNLLSAFMPITLGFLPFVRLPAFSLGLNAILLGAFAAYYQTSGLGLAAYLAGTVPHGVTELAALTISCGAGLYLCDVVTGRLLGRETEPTVGQAWRDCLRAYARWVLPLLFLSALIEAFLTPLIFNLFL